MKSPFASCVGLYGLIADGEGGAEVVSVSTKKDQAKIVWEESKRMVNKNKDLKSLIKTRVNELTFEATESTYKPLASDSDSLDGLNLSHCILDELHAWKDINLYDVINDATTAREQPLVLITTTAGTVRNSIYDQKYEEYSNIIEGYETGGYRDDRTVGFFYELDSESDIHDEKNWVKANPMLDIIKDRDELRRKYNLAMTQPAKMKNLLCKDFNVMQNGASAWLTTEQAINDTPVDLLDLKPRYAIGGADLSRTTDLTSACIMFKMPYSELLYFEHMYWLPADTIEEREEEDGVPYQLWVEQGRMRLCEGNQIDPADVTKWFKEIVELYDIYLFKVGYDDYSAKYWVNEMEEEFGKIMQKVSQGYKTLSLPMQTLGAHFRKHQIVYGNNPITRTHLFNTAVTEDENLNIKPVKGKGRTGRIDGVAAMLDAFTIYFEHQSEYEGLI